jgi:hypothetical protein
MEHSFLPAGSDDNLLDSIIRRSGETPQEQPLSDLLIGQDRLQYQGQEAGQQDRLLYRGQEAGQDRLGQETGQDRLHYQGQEAGQDRLYHQGQEAGRYHGQETGQDRLTHQGQEAGRYHGQETGQERVEAEHERVHCQGQEAHQDLLGKVLQYGMSLYKKMFELKGSCT